MFCQSAVRLIGVYPWAGKGGTLLRLQVLFEESKQVLENCSCVRDLEIFLSGMGPVWDFCWHLQLPEAKAKPEISESGRFYFFLNLFI